MKSIDYTIREGYRAMIAYEFEGISLKELDILSEKIKNKKKKSLIEAFKERFKIGERVLVNPRFLLREKNHVKNGKLNIKYFIGVITNHSITSIIDDIVEYEVFIKFDLPDGEGGSLVRKHDTGQLKLIKEAEKEEEFQFIFDDLGIPRK